MSHLNSQKYTVKYINLRKTTQQPIEGGTTELRQKSEF